jgi:hypothetical protein
MKPIKLYFAGAWTPKTDLGVHNRLVSFHYPKDFHNWIKMSGDKKGDVILDSGAFSAWNKNTFVDLNTYIAYIKVAQDLALQHNKNLHVVNLDVIPGQAGKTKALNQIIGNEVTLAANKELINSAAKQGYLNLKTLKKNGISPIHVFHQGEDFKWLDRMVDIVDYIGISPANDMSNASKASWIDTVFEYLYKKNIKVKTHGFAVMVPELLKRLPWTSCDAISWRMIAATGSVLYPKEGFDVQLPTNMLKPFNMIAVGSLKSYKGHFKNKVNLLALFEKEGYSYEDLQLYSVREIINVRTYLYFEEWLNRYRKEFTYSPINKLL